jgi:hypothetical protein
VNTNESQTDALFTTLETWHVERSGQPTLRYILKSANGTVLDTWEIESEQYLARLSSLVFGGVTSNQTRVAACGETPSDPGDGT